MINTRASRDGHEFHEAWAARKALSLIVNKNKLCGIAVEGLAAGDEDGMSEEAIEIADLVLYYGESPVFQNAETIEIIQLKYSVTSASDPMRVSDAKKTIQKFSKAFNDYSKQYSSKEIDEKLRFKLITNRPICSYFIAAIESLRLKTRATGICQEQKEQIRRACKLKGADLVRFAKIFNLNGLAGNLQFNKQQLVNTMANWSAATDAISRAAIGNIRQLLRDKAGMAGDGKNVIRRVDMLDALGLQQPEDLFPCPASFPCIGRTVERMQLHDIAKLIPNLKKPLIIHADGGVGKTVFLQSLENTLCANHKVILFDCFGGGTYRAPEDARHLPRNGLVHIANTLACDSLCDPLLPGIENVESLIKAFRKRLEQVVATLNEVHPDSQLILFLDAADNAAEHARDRNELSFPAVLLQSLYFSGPIGGVQLVLTCRPYRRKLTIGDLPQSAYEEIELLPFTREETQIYLLERVAGITNTEIHVAFSRSLGNGRVLEYLALDNRALLEPSEVDKLIDLNDLLKNRIDDALGAAHTQGYKPECIASFLAGLAILPPPIPIEEYASIHGMDQSAVNSFASDLAPLLERTNHGMIFRDEPTEDYVRKTYNSDQATLTRISENLFKMQMVSPYAASSLPMLLLKMKDGEKLFELAFDERFPSKISSRAGIQRVKYLRLKAAITYATEAENLNQLVKLLLELSTLAASDERARKYILNSPDLIIVTADIDATRRLFEIRTSWPGTRHSRLTIANILAGNISDGCRHSVQAIEWFKHHYQNENVREKSGPTSLDAASIPLQFIAEGRENEAVSFMDRWKDWYSYEIAKHLFALLSICERLNSIDTNNVTKFYEELGSNFPLTLAAICAGKFEDSLLGRFINNLANQCQNLELDVEDRGAARREGNAIRIGMFDAAMQAINLGMNREATAITSKLICKPLSLWSYSEPVLSSLVPEFIIATAMKVYLTNSPLTESMIYPEEFNDFGLAHSEAGSAHDIRQSVRLQIDKYFQVKMQEDKAIPKKDTTIRDRVHNYLDDRLDPLLEFTSSIISFISSQHPKRDECLFDLIRIWEKLREKRDRHSSHGEVNHFMNQLGTSLIKFCIRADKQLSITSIDCFFEKLIANQTASATEIVHLIELISDRSELHSLSGKIAVAADNLIENESDVANRAALLSRLSRSIMSVSTEESAHYFRKGLDQLDAIGSGDYEFTYELLNYASNISGVEMDDQAFHTLSNICELNMYSEEERFPWWQFAQALSNISGGKTLARLARWHTRGKISLNYTLLPYITALIEKNKIDPEIGIALLRVSDSAELHVCNTKDLAAVIHEKNLLNANELLTELTNQFLRNRFGLEMPSTLTRLTEIAKNRFESGSVQFDYLSKLNKKIETLRDRSHDNEFDSWENVTHSTESSIREEIWGLINNFSDIAENGITQLLKRIKDITGGDAFDIDIFEILRTKVGYNQRAQYLLIIAELEELAIHSKLMELKNCNSLWRASTSTLSGVLEKACCSIVRKHAYDIVDNNYISKSMLKELSELSNIEVPVLTVHLINTFAGSGLNISANLWVGLAAMLIDSTSANAGKEALGRLLKSSSANLSASVKDGPWREGIYPSSDDVEIAGGLVWHLLGSPDSDDRWRAAHCIRTLANFGKWNVIDLLIDKFGTNHSHPFQAPEQPFYYLHARLWLLITLARLSIDYPTEIIRYVKLLESVAYDLKFPHVLMRHFAANCLLSCMKQGAITTRGFDEEKLAGINDSPFSYKSVRQHRVHSFYEGRLESTPKLSQEFSYEYEFRKAEMTNLGSIFHKSCWEIGDLMTPWIHRFDPSVSNMYSNSNYYYSSNRNKNRTDTYGAYLAWHALYLCAGDMLKNNPVGKQEYSDENHDAWKEWLTRQLLTRSDGLWLADGLDNAPVDSLIKIKESDGAVTGDKTRIYELLGIRKLKPSEIVVAGNWRSIDDISIRVSSALISPSLAKSFATKLASTDAFLAWLPSAESYEDGKEFSHQTEVAAKPWIVYPHVELKLDETDPLAVQTAATRMYFTEEIVNTCHIRIADPFGKNWVNERGEMVAQVDAWGNDNVRNDHTMNSDRLRCRSGFLQEFLRKEKLQLLILVTLTKYEKGYGLESSKYWHSTAVLRIDESMNIEYYPGLINKLHDPLY